MRVGVLVLVLLARTALVHADVEGGDAQRLLDEGTRLFTEDASYEAARAAFEESHRIAPSWRALNGIALTYQEQGRYLDAIVTYEQLVHEFDATLTAEQRTTVTKRLALLEAKIGIVELVADQAGVAIALDGVPLGSAPLRRAVRVMPGRHVVVATLAGYQTLTRTIDLGAGGRAPVAIALEPERTIVKVTPVRYERRLPRWVPYATLAGSGLTLAAGGVLLAVARNHFDAFDRGIEEAAHPKSVPGDRDIYDRAVTERRLSTAALAVGGIGAVVGILLLGINQPRAVEVAPTPGGASVAVRF